MNQASDKAKELLRQWLEMPEQSKASAVYCISSL